MKTQNKNQGIPRWQDIVGRTLMALAAIGAFFAFSTAIATVKTADSETIWVESWRMMGFFVFATFFVLLAIRPRSSAGIWELVFLHKTVLFILSLWMPLAKEAALAGMIDGTLAAILLITYLLTRGWRGWSKNTGRTTHVKEALLND